MRPTSSLKRLMATPLITKRALLHQRHFYSSLPAKKPAPIATTIFQQRPQFYPSNVRYNSSVSVPATEGNPNSPRAPVPAYLLTFTCKPCGHRSAHQVTKQGYHHGTVLITCPSCKNRHVISDHLKVFMDQKSSLEDILQRKAGPGGDLSKLLKRENWA